MKIGTDEIKSIKVGETRVFPVTPKEINTTRVLVSYVHSTYPELAKKYKTKVDRKKGRIEITALPC